MILHQCVLVVFDVIAIIFVGILMCTLWRASDVQQGLRQWLKNRNAKGQRKNHSGDKNNIEDKDIVTGAFVGSASNGGGYNLYFQEPMNGGISIQYNF